MKALNLFVSAISAIAIVLGFCFICVGGWGVISEVGNFASSTEPAPRDTMDYVMWGLILVIVGYLGFMRARAATDAGSIDG